jgi:hypothetical protein
MAAKASGCARAPTDITLSELAAEVAPYAAAAGVTPPTYWALRSLAYSARFPTSMRGRNRVVARRDFPAVLAACGIRRVRKA